MIRLPGIEHYKKQYCDIQFERAGLFKLIREKYNCTELLYPGSSVHITPSLYFPHVVYVDRSQSAVDFFANETEVLAYINRKKTYKRSAYIRFIAQNYTDPLPLPKGAFDLLLSLFAPNVVQNCLKYLKQGGLFVTNAVQEEAQAAATSPELQLIAVVRYHKKAYVLSEEKPGQWLSTTKQAKTKRYLKQASGGCLKYVEKENYFVFKK